MSYRAYSLTEIPAAMFWPVWGFLVHILNFRSTRGRIGWIIFGAYAGWTFRPVSGSDGEFFHFLIESMRLGLEVDRTEPIPFMIMRLNAWLNITPNFYSMVLGAIWGLATSQTCTEFLRNHSSHVPLSNEKVFFLTVFFLNQSLWGALNGRYNLSLIIINLALILFLLDRFWSASVLVIISLFTHYGQVFFIAATGLMLVTRRLGKYQINFAYIYLLACFLTPSSLFLQGANLILGSVGAGGGVGDKVALAAKLADARLTGDLVQGGAGVWFLDWYTVPIFYACLLGAQYLFFYGKLAISSPLYQLWILIILMYGLSFLLRGDPEAASRMLRNAQMLLLLWFVVWLMMGREISLWLISALMGPFLFYFFVSYRRAFSSVSLETFLPTPFMIFPAEYFPNILTFLGF